MGGRLVSPLVINANATIEEARAFVAHAFEVNAKAVASAEQRDLHIEPPLEFVLVRHTVAFDVQWYLLRLWDLNTMIPDSAAPDATFLAAIGLGSLQRVNAMQHADMTDGTSAPMVLLTGTRMFGLLAPMLMAAAPGGGRTRGLGVAPPAMDAASPEPTGAAPVPAAAEPAPEAVRIDAAAFVNAPQRTVPDKPFTLELGLIATPMPMVDGGVVAIAFQPGEQSVLLDLRVECAGFVANGSQNLRLLVPRNDPFTPRVTLELKAAALADGLTDDLRALQILYSCKGIACGSATYRILVQREDVPVDIPAATFAVPRVSINTATPPIDLTLRMAWKDDNEASHTLQWSYTSAHNLPSPAGKMIRSSPELAALPISIVDEMAQSDGQEGIELLMGGIAKRIGDEIPAGVWELLHSVSDAVRTARGPDAIPTVLLLTQETRVPWELALMPDPLPDATRQSFLSTQYIITRWILDDAVAAVPPASVSDHDLVAVFGDYSAARQVGQLPYARKEADYITQRSGTALDATRSSIIQLLTGKGTTATGTALAPGILHFAGHGEASRAGTAASFIVLNDGTSLSTTFFLNAPALKRSHPLVFLNACQLGAATSTMGQPGGFAGVCVRGECSVVIAPLWSVNDQVAYDVATHFYDDILGTAGTAGISVAEAMFRARSKPFTDVTFTDANGVSKTFTTATRLAYIVYGHPSFRF